MFNFKNSYQVCDSIYEKFGQSGHRYLFNAMENDPEVSGLGNSYTTEFRQYDPRLGRWKSLDPLMMKFPDQSPYNGFGNNPIFFVDPYGLEPTNDDQDGGGNNEPVKFETAEEADAATKEGSVPHGSTYTNDKGYTQTYDSDLGTWLPPGASGSPNSLKTNDVVNVEGGKIQVVDYHFYPDSQKPMMSITMMFTPDDGATDRENSNYKWVQTYQTNCHTNDNHEHQRMRTTHGQDYNVHDIDDRLNGTKHIRYTDDGMVIDDLMPRFTDDEIKIYFDVNTSLVKVNSNGDIEKRIATFRWGFYINPGSPTGTRMRLRTIDTPTEFHQRMLNEAPEAKDSQYFEIILK